VNGSNVTPPAGSLTGSPVRQIVARFPQFVAPVVQWRLRGWGQSSAGVLRVALWQRLRRFNDIVWKVIESHRQLAGRARQFVVWPPVGDDGDRRRRQIEDVDKASLCVSEAVAGLPETSVRAVLQTIALQARNLTSAQFAAVGIGGDSNRPFETWAVSGVSDREATKIGRDPRPVGLLGLVSTENSVIRVRDLRQHPEFQGFPPNHPGMISFLGVPIRFRGRAAGTLYLANKRGGPEFTEQDQRLIEMLASRVGVAIETSRLYAAEGMQRAWLQAVVDQMPEGIVLMDAEGRVTMRNRSMLSLAASDQKERDRFGNSVTVDLRHPTGERLSPDDLPIVRALLDKRVTQGEELVARLADGRLIPLLASAAPILAKSGELVGATMILEDVSTLKDLERLREEWTSIVVHDLEQPIHTIVLRADLLLRAGLDHKLSEEVGHIRTAAKRLSRMVSDLLDTSQLETQRMRIAVGPVDLAKLVHEVVERTPEAASRTKIRVPVRCQLIVHGDAQRLEQVVTNLLSNAVKYGIPDTEIWIDIAESGQYAKVSVANRGPEVPGDELPLLFDRFVRSRAARTSNTRGLGLGLYIAKGLVEAQGGRIWAEGGPGGMTTFHFTVPLEVSRIVPASSPPSAARGASRSELRTVQP
jgi:PAS domain S-box-containing protein